jgi:thiol-disulfide isomerase/thioredoxin
MQAMTYLSTFVISMAGLTLSSCVSANASDQTITKKPNHSRSHHAGHDEPRPYIRSANAAQDVDKALERAKLSGKKVLLVMGANWCHDSRALAANFQTPLLAPLIEDAYELVYVDVGEVQRGPRDLNIDIAQRYGINEIVGTPTVLILTGNGQLLNKDTAPRSAGHRKGSHSRRLHKS